MTTKKKPRTDKRKNIGKVAEVIATNPNKTIREIAKETDLWIGTTHRAKEELEQTGTKDDTIRYIVDASKARIKKAQSILDRFLQESETKETLNRSDTALIKDIIKDDMTRVTIFWGDATDEEWALKNPTNVNIIVGGSADDNENVKETE